MIRIGDPHPLGKVYGFGTDVDGRPTVAVQGPDGKVFRSSRMDGGYDLSSAPYHQVFAPGEGFGFSGLHIGFSNDVPRDIGIVTSDGTLALDVRGHTGGELNCDYSTVPLADVHVLTITQTQEPCRCAVNVVFCRIL